MAGALPRSVAIVRGVANRVVSESVTIPAAPEAIFEILADPRRHPEIDGSGTLRGRATGPARLSHGEEFGMDMRLGPLRYRIRNRVVEFEEGRRIAWRHLGGHRWRFVLEPGEAGTRVTESFDYSRFPWWSATFIELLRYPARNRAGIRATLARLSEAATPH